MRIEKSCLDRNRPKIVPAVAQYFHVFYCLKELRSFLGLCTYVPRFIESFSEKTVVLREVLKQDEKFKWQPKHQEAFERLKVDLASPNVLAFYDPSKEVQLVTDASNHGIG